MAKNLSKVKCSKCTKFIYENSNSIECDDCHTWFHLRCSKLKVNDFNKFVKDKNLKFYCDFCAHYKCEKCSKPVFDHQNGIFCNSCKLWYHLRCSKLSQIQYHKLSKSNEHWICANCFTFPFHGINDDILLENMDNAFDNLDTHVKNVLNQSVQFSTKCSVCLRKTINKRKRKKIIPCQSCHSLIHRTCSNIPLSDLLNANIDLKLWECKTCLSDKFPFSDIDNSDILNMNFNSNFDCNCNINSSPKTNELNFARFQYSQYIQDNDNDIFGPDPDNLTDKVFDFHPDFDYYNIHDFHKLSKKVQNQKKNNFSLFHSNFENLEILLHDLGDPRFDIIALSETWDPKSKLNFRPGILKGYHEYKGTQGNSIKGGCGLYINKNLKFIERNDLSISFVDDNNEFQSFWIEIVNKKSVNIIIGVYYRHPKKNSDYTFNTHLKETIKTLDQENK